jgi:hypothetical protein
MIIKRQGTSLLELGAVVAIIAMLMLLLGGGRGCVTTSERQASAETNGRNFALAMGWQITGIVCSGEDSSVGNKGGDGYVSCTLALKQPTSDVPTGAIIPATRSIQCAYKKFFAPWGQNTACKENMAITVQTQ